MGRLRTYLLLTVAVSLWSFRAVSQTSIAAQGGNAQGAAAGQDGQHDFDFLFGRWKVHARRLLRPLTGSDQWVEFDGTIDCGSRLGRSGGTFTIVTGAAALCQALPNHSEIRWWSSLSAVCLVFVGAEAYQPHQLSEQSARPLQTANSISSRSSPKRHSFKSSRNSKAPAGSDEVQTNGSVCGDPSAACRHPDYFGENDLSFHLPAQLALHKNYYSAKFYAVILRSQPAVYDNDRESGNCEQGMVPEAERQRIQALFPTHKVFTSTMGCLGSPVGYLNMNYDYNFVAVYAGNSLVEAKSMLAKVKATRQFPEANIRKTQIVLSYGFGD